MVLRIAGKNLDIGQALRTRIDETVTEHCAEVFRSRLFRPGHGVEERRMPSRPTSRCIIDTGAVFEVHGSDADAHHELRPGGGAPGEAAAALQAPSQGSLTRERARLAPIQGYSHEPQRPPDSPTRFCRRCTRSRRSRCCRRSAASRRGSLCVPSARSSTRCCSASASARPASARASRSRTASCAALDRLVGIFARLAAAGRFRFARRPAGRSRLRAARAGERRRRSPEGAGAHRPHPARSCHGAEAAHGAGRERHLLRSDRSRRGLARRLIQGAAKRLEALLDGDGIWMHPPWRKAKQGEDRMPFYLYQIAYAPAATKAMVGKPQDREKVARSSIEFARRKTAFLLLRVRRLRRGDHRRDAGQPCRRRPLACSWLERGLLEVPHHPASDQRGECGSDEEGEESGIHAAKIDRPILRWRRRSRRAKRARCASGSAAGPTSPGAGRSTRRVCQPGKSWNTQADI